MSKISCFLLVQIILLVTGCRQVKENGSPVGYNLAKPVIYEMPSVLNEISGISFSNNADTVYAVQDEEGKVFYFHPGDKVVNHSKFSKQGDYEDIAIFNESIVTLRSDGALFTFPFNEIYGGEIVHVSAQDGILPGGEYESLYSDQRKHLLYVLCKTCRQDIATGNISGYILKAGDGGNLVLQNGFWIDGKKIAALAGEKKLHFKPSALAQNPKTNEWYILSSVNKMLLIASDKWMPLNIGNLAPSLFTQPEGIGFDNEGNLYISNESGNGKKATILLFLSKK